MASIVRIIKAYKELGNANRVQELRRVLDTEFRATDYYSKEYWLGPDGQRVPPID